MENNKSNDSDGKVLYDGKMSFQLMPVVVCSLILVVFCILGFVSNLAVLVSTRCKRTLQQVKYGGFYGLCVTDIMLCLIWVPLELVCIIRGFIGTGTHPMLCYLQVAIFNFCVAVVVLLAVSITLHQLLVMWCPQNGHVSRVMAICGLITLIVSTVFALVACMEYPSTPDYSLCVSGVIFDSSVYATLFAKSVLLLLALIATMVAFMVFVLLRRLNANVKSSPKKSSPVPNKSLKFQEINATELDDSRFNVSDSVASNEPSSSSMKSSKSKSSGKRGVAFLGFAKKDQESDEGSDDDQFDLKMKLKLQKSGSGRRHTVANIGLSEANAGGRRRSLGDRAGSPNAMNYTYVRKWSVDITALQQQLENPKLHLQGSPFPELKKFREKHAAKQDSIQEMNSPDELEEEEEEETQEQTVKEEEKKEELKEEVTEEEEVQEEVKEEKKKAEEPETLDEDKILEEIDNANCSTELLPHSPTIPSIVVNGNNALESNGDQSTECVKCGGEISEQEKRLKEHLHTASICVLLLVVVFLFTLPYAVVQVLQSAMHIGENRNWSCIASALFLVQCPLHPVLIAWKEPKIYEALKKLHYTMTHWRCVCYCNIGKGKSCLGRGSSNNYQSSAPVVHTVG